MNRINVSAAGQPIHYMSAMDFMSTPWVVTVVSVLLTSGLWAAARRLRGRAEERLLPPLIIEATERHTHSVILLHGMYCTGEMFKTVPQIMSELGGQPGNIRWIFPNAPKRKITWPNDEQEGVSAWYNYFTSNGGTMEHDLIDEKHLASVTRQVHAIIDSEAARLDGDTTRIAIGGNSQGGTVAMHSALTYPLELGALLGLCTTLLDVTPVAQRAVQAMPVFLFTAENDQEVKLAS